MHTLNLRVAVWVWAGSVILLLLVVVSQNFIPPVPELTYYNRENGDYDIYLMDVNRGVTFNLTRNPDGDTHPAWSPDGRQLAFYSHRNRRTDLYIMNADGSGLHRLTDSGGPGAYPDWSSDGQWIAFASIKIKEGGIYRIHPDGSDLQRLTDLRASLLAWSPDSQQIVFTSDCDNNCDIYLMNADGSALRRLTYSGEFDGYPVWSPDSQHIAFMSNRDGNFEVYVMDVDCDETLQFSGCEAQRLTDNRGFDGFPDWSPDGKRIAFSSDRDGNFEIYSLPADCYLQVEGCPSGTRLTNRSASDVGPVWSPDGRQIVFVSAADVYVMNEDGSGLRRLARGVLRDQFLTWRP